MSMSSLGPYWQLVAKAKELACKPLRVFLDGRYLVLFRTASGNIGALEDRCAHRNAPLSQGRVCGECLQCPYHGWQYDTSGKLTEVPALRRLNDAAAVRVPHYSAIESQGFIWVAPADKATDPPPVFPHYGERGWSSFVMRTRFHGSVEACLENFLDCPHATFVHRYWFRAPTGLPVRAEVRTLEDGAIAEFFDEPRKKSLVWWLLAPKGGAMRHTDRYIQPAMSRVDYEFPGGLHYIISSSCTRRTPTETEVFTVMSFRWGWLGPLIRLYFEPLSRWIIRQDVAMLHAQQANIEQFGGARFASTRADLLGRYIAEWRCSLAGKSAPPAAGKVYSQEILL